MRLIVLPTAILLGLTSACISDPGGTSNGGEVSPTASSGRAVQSCEEVVREGAPVTERLIADGCLSSSGQLANISPYLCRGSGDTVLEFREKRLIARVGSFPLDQPRSAPPEKVYGYWAAPGPYAPAPDADVNDCLFEAPPFPDDPGGG